MKETKIAKENIEDLRSLKEDFELHIWANQNEEDIPKREVFCLTHKQTCQRWLICLNIISDSFDEYDSYDFIEGYTDDLKQAIKLYEDAGI